MKIASVIGARGSGSGFTKNIRNPIRSFGEIFEVSSENKLLCIEMPFTIKSVILMAAAALSRKD
jgi:hypothetical protein